MKRLWPDYGTPGAPNADPYYLSDRDLAKIEDEEAESERAAAEAAADEARAAADDAALCAILDADEEDRNAVGAT